MFLFLALPMCQPKSMRGISSARERGMRAFEVSSVITYALLKFLKLWWVLLLIVVGVQKLTIFIQFQDLRAITLQLATVWPNENEVKSLLDAIGTAHTYFRTSYELQLEWHSPIASHW